MREFELFTTFPQAQHWQLDGQAVAGIEVEDDQTLRVDTYSGKVYRIGATRTLMKDEQGWGGWVMDEAQRRQVYLAIGGTTALITEDDTEGGALKAETDETEDASADVDIEVAAPRTARRVRLPRWRMSVRATHAFLLVWPLVLAPLTVFVLVSVIQATATQPLGRWPALAGAWVAWIAIGYLGMWWAAPEARPETDADPSEAQEAGHGHA